MIALNCLGLYGWLVLVVGISLIEIRCLFINCIQGWKYFCHRQSVFSETLVVD